MKVTRYSPEADSKNGDLISRQAAIDIVDEYADPDYLYGWYEKIRSGLATLPSAQPEIVHCRDCKHASYRTYLGWQEPIYTCAHLRSMWNMDGDFEVNPDDFCSHGERRQE